MAAVGSDQMAMTRWRFDVVVLGGTAAGCAAAIAAAREGARVLLAEASPHLGGLMTSGLGATDIGPRATIGGLFRRLILDIHRHYVETYGAGSEQVKVSAEGYHFEPSVAERCLGQLLGSQAGITVWYGWSLAWEGGPSLLNGGRWLVETVAGAGPDQPNGTPERRVVSITLEPAGGTRQAAREWRRVEARVFIDATYEGDLALGAGASYRIGRESREEFGEPHAGIHYQDFRTKLGYPGSTGAADRRVQAYNYRLCLTNVAANRLPVKRPAQYDRARYLPLAQDVAAGKVRGFMGRSSVGLLNNVPLPNAKTDCNNHHYCFTSTDWPEENFDYAESGPERRRAIAAAHRAYVEGLLWFAQHDDSLPDWFRAEARQWGYAADEFEDNGGFPRQLYVREAARLYGDYCFSARDAMRAPDGGRAPVHWDSIASGGYSIDSHATRKREDLELSHTTSGAAEALLDGRQMALEGFLSIPGQTVPYQLPYRIMLPEGIDGLLVPVAVSATHLGFGTIRMEPTWMALGEAAGTAAGLAVQAGVRVRDVSRATLQRKLLMHGQVLTYFEDVAPPRFPGFDALPPELSAAVQFWGARGFFATYRVRPHEPLLAGEARRWLWLVQRSVDPWCWMKTDPDTFTGNEPITRGALRAELDALLAEPSPLRRSLGLPALPTATFEPADWPVTRGEACRWLYRLLAPYAL